VYIPVAAPLILSAGVNFKDRIIYQRPFDSGAIEQEGVPPGR